MNSSSYIKCEYVSVSSWNRINNTLFYFSCMFSYVSLVFSNIFCNFTIHIFLLPSVGKPFLWQVVSIIFTLSYISVMTWNKQANKQKNKMNSFFNIYISIFIHFCIFALCWTTTPGNQYITFSERTIQYKILFSFLKQSYLLSSFTMTQNNVILRKGQL